MTAADPVDAARKIMEAFARDTGLSSDRPPRRYLWTDAFSVCNYLGLHDVGGAAPYLELARTLVDQVHRVLGRHRDDDPREGWISGLGQEEGARRPTAGGLRIGKPLPERPPGEPADPRKEWDRDGQYYHYLTKWMHALNRMWEVTADEAYHRWAVELAEAAHRGFLVSGGAEKRLYWKMSIDLSRPLVRSTGHHDPLDGFLVGSELVGSAPAGSAAEAGMLDPVLRDLREMCRGRMWATDDPLGAGGLLVDAYRCRLMRGSERFMEDGLCDALLDDAAASLEAVAGSDLEDRPAGQRLGFRELGLSIGIRAAGRLLGASGAGAREPEPALPPRIRRRLERYLPLADAIEEFWLEPGHRRSPGWSEHRDISRVMLATSLAPSGYLA